MGFYLSLVCRLEGRCPQGHKPAGGRWCLYALPAPAPTPWPHETPASPDRGARLSPELEPPQADWLAFNPMTPNCPLAERSRLSRGGRSGPAPTRAHPWPTPPAAPDPAWSRTQQWAASADGVFHRAQATPKSLWGVQAQSQKDGWVEEALCQMGKPRHRAGEPCLASSDYTSVSERVH